MKRGVQLAAGIAAGASVMYVLDPDRGPRRRALVRDKLMHAANKGADALDTLSRDALHRAQGVVAETRARFTGRQAPDEILIERVRAKLGRVVSHPGSVEVSAREGCVTLSGPILKSEVPTLLDAVARVRGVGEIENVLEVHEQAGDIPGLQGGKSRIVGDRFELMQENWSPTARLLVGGAGGTLALYGAGRRDAFGTLVAAFGLGLLARAATNLEFSRLLGVGAGRRAIDVQKTINIVAPVEEVFAFWRDFQNFPKFMTNVREVRTTSLEGQSHWTICGPGADIEFDAVVTDYFPNRVIAWKTVEGSPVGHAGLAHFEETPDGGTRVHIRMSYNPPAGAIGHAAAALLGQDLRTKLDQDLLRMKSLLETGRQPHDAAQHDRTMSPADVAQPRAVPGT